MSVRTGKQFVAGLGDGREVWYDGRRVDDVTTFPPFAAAIRSMAMLYDLQHATEHRDVLTVESAELGGRIARCQRIGEQLAIGTGHGESLPGDAQPSGVA